MSEAAPKKLPKEILSLFYAPGRKLAQLYVELQNIPGALAKVSHEIAKHKINILSGIHTLGAHDEKGDWSFFADFTESDISPTELVESLKKIDVVRDVGFVEPTIEGLLIDNFHFPVTWGGSRAIVIRVDVFADMIGRLWGAFGTGAQLILFEMGSEAGQKIAERLKGLGGKEPAAKLARELIKAYSAVGWGCIDLSEFNMETCEGYVKVYNSFECEPFRGKSNKPRSFFLRGHISNAMSVILGKKLSATEIKCVAQGDPFCEFKIKAEERIEI